MQGEEMALFIVSYQIFDVYIIFCLRDIHEVLNINKKKLVKQFVCNLWDEFFKPI